MAAWAFHVLDGTTTVLTTLCEASVSMFSGISFFGTATASLHIKSISFDITRGSSIQTISWKNGVTSPCLKQNTMMLDYGCSFEERGEC